MQEPDFWTANADAMELTIEGNRLIAREVADLISGFWHRLTASLNTMVHSEHHHLPPV